MGVRGWRGRVQGREGRRRVAKEAKAHHGRRRRRLLLLLLLLLMMMILNCNTFENANIIIRSYFPKQR
jgi:hypothetical protein